MDFQLWLDQSANLSWELIPILAKQLARVLNYTYYLRNMPAKSKVEFLQIEKLENLMIEMGTCMIYSKVQLHESAFQNKLIDFQKAKWLAASGNKNAMTVLQESHYEYRRVLAEKINNNAN